MTDRVIETNTDKLFLRFPHLRQLERIWGTSECRKFIFQLMTDTRGGTRQGFPSEHAMTIMSLLMEHDRRFPQFENDVAHSDTRWGDTDRRGTRGF